MTVMVASFVSGFVLGVYCKEIVNSLKAMWDRP